MSVRGEFTRTVAETIRRLEAIGDARAREVARGLERARAHADEDLTRAAESAIGLWESGPAEALPPGSPAREALVEAGDHMAAIARVILGR